MAHLRKEDEGANRFIDFRTRPAAPGLSAAIYSHISFRSVSASGWRTNPLMNGGGLGPLAQPAKDFFAVDGLHPAALYVIVAAIQHVAHLG